MSEHGHRANVSMKRGVVSMIFSFFLSVALTLAIVLSVVCIGMLSEQGFISIFDDEYYESLLTYTNEKMTSYTYPTGIDPSVVEGVITREDVERDVTGLVRSAFGDVQYEPDISDIESRLTAHVTVSLIAGDAEVSGEMLDAVNAYVGEIKDIYLEAMKLPGLDAIASLRDTYYLNLIMLLGISVCMAVVLMVIIRGLHRFLHRSLRYVAYATGGAALMCLIAPLILYASHAYDGLRFRPMHFYHFGITAITHALALIAIGGIVLAAVTVLLASLIARMREGIVHRRSHSRRHE